QVVGVGAYFTLGRTNRQLVQLFEPQREVHQMRKYPGLFLSPFARVEGKDARSSTDELFDVFDLVAHHPKLANLLHHLASNELAVELTTTDKLTVEHVQGIEIGRQLAGLQALLVEFSIEPGGFLNQRHAL